MPLSNRSKKRLRNKRNKEFVPKPKRKVFLVKLHKVPSLLDKSNSRLIAGTCRILFIYHEFLLWNDKNSALGTSGSAAWQAMPCDFRDIYYKFVEALLALTVFVRKEKRRWSRLPGNIVLIMNAWAKTLDPAIHKFRRTSYQIARCFLELARFDISGHGRKARRRRRRLFKKPRKFFVQKLLKFLAKSYKLSSAWLVYSPRARRIGLKRGQIAPISIIGWAWFVGSAVRKTNRRLRSVIFFSKNNVDIFRRVALRVRFLQLHATFAWLLYSALRSCVFNPKIKFMFASINPVFAKLMRWAAEQTQGLYSGNRWLSGMLSASTQIPDLPHYLFIPDADNNALIMRESLRHHIAIISLVSTDSTYFGDVPLLGNNKEFKIILDTLRIIIYTAATNSWKRPGKGKNDSVDGTN